MAYESDKLPSELDEITTADMGDVFVLGDSSDSNRAKKLTIANLLTQLWAATATLTNKTISLASNTVTMTLAQLNTAVSDADIASLTGSETLTNKDISSSTNTYRSASDTVVGGVELATSTETTTGTDATRAITPDGLAGSDFGKKGVSVMVFGGTVDVATGDGKAYLTIPDGVGGMNLIGVHARVVTAGTTGTTDIQIHNVTQTADMLSTKITIDSTETGSDTAATPAVIDATNDDVADNDLLRIDVDAVSTTAPKGLVVTLVFQLP